MTWVLKPLSTIFRIGFFLLLFLPYNTQAPEARKELCREIINLFAVIGVMAALYPFGPARHIFHIIGNAAAKIASLPDRWLLVLFSSTFFILACTLSGIIFHHIPHIADSQAHYIQAKIFLSGHFTQQSHKFQAFFPIEFFNRFGKLYSSYPPGHVFFLALGMLIGLPWIINPLLGSLFVVAIYFLSREIGDRITGIIAMCLTIVSPFIVFISSEYMSHATALLMQTLFLLFYIRMLKHGRWQDAALAGLSLGYLGITREQCAAMMGLVYGIHASWMCFMRFRHYVRLNAILCASALPFFLFLLYYNWCTTGSPWITGYQKIQGFDMKVAFTSWKSQTFPLGDLTRVANQSGTLGLEFFCWPIPSFALMALLFLFRAERPYCFLLVGTYFSYLFGLFLFLCESTTIFSSRYLYEASGTIIVFTALALQRIPTIAWLQILPFAKKQIWAGALVLACLGFTIAGLYGRTGQLFHLYSDHYWQGNVDYYYNIMNHIKKPALVFIPDPFHYHYVVFDLPPNDKAAVIFALNIPKHNQLIIDYYPGRHIYSLADPRSPGMAQHYAHGGCMKGGMIEF